MILQLLILGTMGERSLLVGATHKKMTPEAHNCAEVSVEMFHADALELKGNPSLVLCKMTRSLGHMMRFASIRLILAMVASLDLKFHQMDVKTAFLNGELDEVIFMDQPIGFMVKGQKCKVCRLNRSLYGLKQSSRQWYK
jgi:hypothetical protein